MHSHAHVRTQTYTDTDGSDIGENGSCGLPPGIAFFAYTHKHTQVALTVAKMARVDFPQEWPSLFHELLSLLPSETPPPSPSVLSSQQQQQQQQQQQPQYLARARRVYLVLHHLLKVWAVCFSLCVCLSVCIFVCVCA